MQGIGNISWKDIQGPNETTMAQLEVLVEYINSLSSRDTKETKDNFIYLLNVREQIAGHGSFQALANFDYEIIENSWKFGQSPFTDANVAKVQKVRYSW